MANSREIQGRMKSIQDTAKITNAMYMVSSSKLQKARRDLKNTEPYFYLIQDSLAKILDASPNAGNKFFDKRPQRQGKGRTIGYLLITADKGLAGAYNHNVIKLAEKLSDNDCENMFFVVGQLGRHYLEKKGVPIDIHFNYTAQNPTINRARHIAGKLADLFLEQKIDELYVIYTKMVNSITVEAVSKKIFPLEQHKIHMQDNDLTDDYQEMTFLPDPETVFNTMVPSYITGFIYGTLIESYCSEHNARMLAMQTAGDSAAKMLRELSVQYNRARQAAITQEITEVVGGAAASREK